MEEVILANHPLLDERGAEAILPATESSRSTGLVKGAEWRQVLGSVLILVGVVAVGAAWFGVSGTNVTGEQLSYLTSGGLGGLALVGAGAVLVMSFEHSHDRRTMAAIHERLRRLEEKLERGDSLGDLAVVADQNGMRSEDRQFR